MKHLKFALVLGIFALTAIPAQAARICDGQCALIVADAKCKHLRSNVENLSCITRNGATQDDTPALCAQARSLSGCVMKADAGGGNRARSTGLSPQQIAACTTDIHNKQRESQRWGGDVNDISNRLGRYQKDLFEGRCAGHPEAAAYLRGANTMLGYRRETSTSMPSSGGQPTTYQSSQSSSPSRASRGQNSQTSSSSHKGRNYVGGHKQCIRFTPEKEFSSGAYQWYSYHNGCNITLKVCDIMSGNHWGCGHTIQPGKTSKNWNTTANVRRNGGNFFACSTSENGKSVHFDKVTHTCYHYR